MANTGSVTTSELVMMWRIELYAAAQLLKGQDLADFTELIREISQVLDAIHPAVGEPERRRT